MLPILTTTFNLIVKPPLGALVVELARSSQQKQHIVPDTTDSYVITVQEINFNKATQLCVSISTRTALKV